MPGRALYAMVTLASLNLASDSSGRRRRVEFGFELLGRLTGTLDKLFAQIGAFPLLQSTLAGGWASQVTVAGKDGNVASEGGPEIHPADPSELRARARDPRLIISFLLYV